uniref:Peptidylglycine alpha-hydroxylating monooxygenase n=1 Tax=Triatoma infestans TaxID=30076 RepID=A0A161M2V6_TRIIF
MQVHYAHSMHGGSDNSGVNLFYTGKPMPKLAGVLLLGTAGFIRPMSMEHMETACTIDED